MQGRLQPGEAGPCNGQQCWCSRPHPASHQAGKVPGKCHPFLQDVDVVRWASRGSAGSCKLSGSSSGTARKAQLQV